jgi:hypothetical protein
MLVYHKNKVHCSRKYFIHPVACRPAAEEWLYKQRPLLGNRFIISNNWTATEERCSVCGQCRNCIEINFIATLRIIIDLPTYIHTHTERRSVNVRLTVVITQFQVITDTVCLALTHYSNLKLCSRSWLTLLIRVYWEMIKFWCGYVKCSINYKEDGLRMTICEWYWWVVALNVGLDASFDNI